jgi:hypothetical protein
MLAYSIGGLMCVTPEQIDATDDAERGDVTSLMVVTAICWTLDGLLRARGGGGGPISFSPLLVPLSTGGYNAPAVVRMALGDLCHVVTEVRLLGC